MSKFAQNRVFLFLEGDTINGFKWNLACKRRPRVYCLLPYLARIGKGGWTQDPLPEMWFFLSKLRHFSSFSPHRRHNTPIQMTLSL